MRSLVLALGLLALLAGVHGKERKYKPNQEVPIWANKSESRLGAVAAPIEEG